MKFNFAIRSNPIQSTHTTPFLSTTKQPVRITNNEPIKSRHDLIFYRSMAMAMATDGYIGIALVTKAAHESEPHQTGNMIDHDDK